MLGCNTRRPSVLHKSANILDHQYPSHSLRFKMGHFRFSLSILNPSIYTKEARQANVLKCSIIIPVLQNNITFANHQQTGIPHHKVKIEK